MTFEQQITDMIGDIPASIKWHHTYRGGLLQHTKEVAFFVSQAYNQELHQMSLNDLLVLAWVHDLNKVGRYKEIPADDWRRGDRYKSKYGEFEHEDKIYINETAEVVSVCSGLGIQLTNEQLHALTFHHGGWAADRDVNATKHPAAILLHYADMMSVSWDRLGKKVIV